ncbi:hypothetical protein WJX72_007330 [[Myrmecia] bisecta]|uniref:BTB domain-containing protein n=1 Tax=[Myrmecia] bisecta TaxID=41462 RepID=A0AAW1PA42_9CHLO
MAGAAGNEKQVFETSSLEASLPQLANLWQQGDLCDVVLLGKDGVTVPAHQIILAAASPYWAALLAGSGQEMQGGSCKRRKLSDGHPVLEASDFNASSLRVLLQAIYGLPYQITEHNVDALLAGSNCLEIGCVQTACCKHLQQRLQADTCWTTLATAMRFSCEALRDEVVAYIHANFEALMAFPEQAGLHQLPRPALLDILQSIGDCRHEQATIQVLLTWLAGDAIGRLADLPELLAAVIKDAGAAPTLAGLVVLALSPRYLLGQTMEPDMLDFYDERFGPGDETIQALEGLNRRLEAAGASLA